jgi:hypothetical protein
MIDKFPDITVDYSKPYGVQTTIFSSTGRPGDPPYRTPVEEKNDDGLVDDLHSLAAEVEQCEPSEHLQRQLILMLKCAAIKISELQRKIDDDY